MKIHGLGINIADDYVDGRQGRLSDRLRLAERVGYTVAELGITGLNVIINGELIRERVEAIQQAMAPFDLRYSVHAPGRSNLAFCHDPPLEYRVLQACLRFCHAIGAGVLVYHSGLQALEAARSGTAPLPSDDELARGAAREVAALRRLAPLAADLGVTIGMENGDPHLWEYAVLARTGKSAEQLVRYHERLRTAAIVAQVERVDHPSVGITLDLAHLHLATHALGEDYLEAISVAGPWVRHLHINDNFGKLDRGFDAERDRLPYGEADLHLPPGWGAIPFVEAFERLREYEGDIVLEIKERYLDHLGEALDNTSRILGEGGHEVVGLAGREGRVDTDR
ncbi:MAG: sugar phosphate isomerase/epimerase [Chloroflexi bacterium]|nr:sugar phosphate isomerase/epimerase [Chloroflexota bacterium]